MQIHYATVYVQDQGHAREFYTGALGFELRHDIPVGADSWLTVVSPADPDGPELLLSPSGHAAVRPYMEALKADGIPATMFMVEDIAAECERLSGLGVRFTQEPQEAGGVLRAVFDDTCGNLIAIAQPRPQ